MGGDGNDTYSMSMLNGTSTDFAGKTYNFMTLTKDTIIDSDGNGTVIAGGITLTGGTATDDTNTVFESNGFTYALSGLSGSPKLTPSNSFSSSRSSSYQLL